MASRFHKSAVDPASQRMRDIVWSRIEGKITLRELETFVGVPYEKIKRFFNLGGSHGRLKWTLDFIERVAPVVGLTAAELIALGRGNKSESPSSIIWDGRKDESDILLSRLRAKLRTPGLSVIAFRRTVPMRLVTPAIQCQVFQKQFSKAPKAARERLLSNYAKIADELRSRLALAPRRPVVDTFMFRREFENFVFGRKYYHGCRPQGIIDCLDHMQSGDVRLTLMNDIGWNNRVELRRYKGVMVGENTFAFTEDVSHGVRFVESALEIVAVQQLMIAVRESALNAAECDNAKILQDYKRKVEQRLGQSRKSIRNNLRNRDA